MLNSLFHIGLCTPRVVILNCTAFAGMVLCTYAAAQPSSEIETSSISWKQWVAPFEDPLDVQEAARQKPLSGGLTAPPQLSELRLKTTRNIPALEQSELSCMNFQYAVSEARLQYRRSQSEALKNQSLSMSLGGALGRALCLNPQVRNSWTTIQKASSELGLSKSSYWPQASLGVMRQHSRIGYSGAGDDSSTVNATSQSFNISWRVFDFGARSAKHRAAQAQLRAALASRSQTVREVVWGVMDTYVQAQTLHAQLKRQSEISELGKVILQSSENRYAKGASARNALMQSHATIERNRFESEKIRADLLITEQKLRGLIGIAVLQPLKLDDIPDEFAEVTALQQEADGLKMESMSLEFLDDWLQKARDINPAVKAATAKLEAAEATVQAVTSDAMPKIDVNYSYYRNGRPTQSITGTRSTEQTAGLSLTIPLFEGFASSYRVQGAEASRQAAHIELDTAQIQSDQELLAAYTQAQAGISMLNAAFKLYETSQQLVQSNQKLFQHGVVDSIEVHRSLLDLQSANVELANAQAQWLRAKLHLWLLSA